MKSLADLYREHDGKVSDKWELYIDAYEGILAPYRSQSVSLLEIGIQNGGSLEIWEKYFPNFQKIIGCDIDPKCALLTYENSNVKVIVGDANGGESRKKILEISSSFDIVIDDGSHLSSDIIKSFLLYFPALKEGGIFIAEDLHCSYWLNYEGGIYHPYSSISFFKRLADILNFEHWGNGKARVDLLKGFFSEYGVSVDEDCLSHIHSVEFINSICVIKKASSQKNLLGRRVVVGARDLVSPNPLIQKGTTYKLDQFLLQLENIHSMREIAPDESILDFEKKLDEAECCVNKLKDVISLKETALADLLQDIESRDAVISNLAQELAQCKTTINLLYVSSSWRLTAPFRRFKELFAKARYRLMLSRLRQLTAFILGIGLVNQCLKKYRAVKFSFEYKGRLISNSLSKFNSIGQLVCRLWFIFRSEGIRGLSSRYKRIAQVNFSEKEYLLRRPDVAEAVSQGDFKSGLDHYLKYGIYEGHIFETNDYGLWVDAYSAFTQKSADEMSKRMASFKVCPLISILIPTYNPPEQWLIDAIESVREQIYSNWELCIADDASTNSSIRSILKEYAEKDNRIKVTFREINGHISAASNSALELASGEWVALLDQDDLLSIDALYWVVNAINQNPECKLIYSDEDKVNEFGKRFDPYFKSDWNRDLFYSQNMISHLGVYKADLLRDVGGFRIGLEGSQDYDLALRFIENIDDCRIHHIARVLYHWRVHAGSTASSADAKPYAMIAGERALNEHFLRQGIGARAELIGFGYRVHYEIPQKPPLVSIIIPTRNGLDLLRNCIVSLIENTVYKNYEIIIIDNGSDDNKIIEYFDYLKSQYNIKIIRDDGPFNYSALNNSAVKLAKGELIALINNDLRVISPDWLSEMVGIALQPKVGAVGARLWYPDNTLQHGGVILGLGASGVAGHAHHRMQKGHNGYFGRANLINSFSAVSAACLLVRKTVFESVGGLNEVDLKVAFNDVDFCLRLKEAGYRNVWTPYADLYHYESATRGVEDSPERLSRFNSEVEYMKNRWGSLLDNDPYYNKNLSTSRGDFSLKWPPEF